MLPFLDRASPRFDADAVAFAARSGATDVRGLSDFFKGVKRLGVWNDIVFWPATAGHSAQTGTLLHSAGGLGKFDGTLVNGPTWTAIGLTGTAGAQHRVTTVGCNFNAPCTLFFVGKWQNPGSFIYMNRYSLDQVGSDQLSDQDIKGITSLSPNTARQMLSASVSVSGGNVTGSLYRNGGVNSASATVVQSASDSGSAMLMNSSAGRGAEEMSFAAITNRVLGATQHAELYALYRATLGKQLGLP